MKILVTGGTGVVGVAAVAELMRHGHTVRLLSRNADRDVSKFGDGVEPWPGSITDCAALRDAASGCGAVIHIAGIVSEDPPQATFQKVNVLGTKNMLEHAARAGVRKFIYLSSLGADIGASPYHASKRQAEALVQGFEGDWVILRPGGVYGPGDDLVSLLLRMIRTLPAVPVIDGGDKLNQPIWADDLARAIWLCVEREDVRRSILEVAGDELISMNQMLDRMALLTGRTPMRIPLPGAIAGVGAGILSSMGVQLPFSPSQIRMLIEGNRIAPGKPNALTEILGITPAPLDDNLRELLDLQPEQIPEGKDGLFLYRRTAGVFAGDVDADEAFAQVRLRFADLFPTIVDSAPEPGARKRVALGETLTLGLPFRGNVQVRVVEVRPRQFTCITLGGHPLAGAVAVSVLETEAGLVLEVQTYDEPSTLADKVAMRLAGRTIQNFTWQQFLHNAAEMLGTKILGDITIEERQLTPEEAEPVTRWLRSLSEEHVRGRLTP